MADKKTFSGKCVCGNTLLYEQDQQVVHCEYCERDIAVSDFRNNVSNDAVAATNNAVANFMATIDNADSALAYLNSFFETFNWAEFNETAELTVASVDKMVETNLIKSAANPSTWELQFKSVATPLLKKVEGLKDLEAKFFSIYIENADFTDAIRVFDIYSRVSAKILAEKDAVIAKLDSAIKFAKKYGAGADLVKELTASLDAVKKAVESVKEIKTYKELPGFDKAEKEKSEKFITELKKKGVNAEEVYNIASKAFNAGDRGRDVLAKFHKIVGYKDAQEKKNALDVWVRFGNSDEELIKLGEKYYILRNATASYFNPADKEEEGKKGKKEKVSEAELAAKEAEDAELASMKCKELVEVSHGKKSDTPAVTRITKLLAHYGTHLYYIKDNKTLCVFDSTVQNEAIVEIDKAKVGAYQSITNGEIKCYFYTNMMYMRKKLEAKIEKLGCFKALFKKNKEVVITSDNNYELIAIDLATNEVTTAIEEIVDVTDVYGDEIFFTKVIDDEGVKRTEFCAFNTITKEQRKVLEQDNEIVDVVDGKVIYMTWQPTRYNRDLYAKDFKTGEVVLLERNMLDFFKTINGRVYFTVGNYYEKSLFSVAIDGTDRCEILQNANGIDARNTSVLGGWIYLKKGTGLNSILYKISADGKKTILLCTQFDKVVLVKDMLMYYKNTQGTLCSVRLDGTDYKELVKNINVVSVDDNFIFYTRREFVGKKIDRSIAGVFGPAENMYSNSLYKIDTTGHNVVKLAFDVTAVVENKYNKNELYLSKNEIKTYEILTPVQGKKNQITYTAEYVTKSILDYFKYNKDSGEFSPVLELGAPEITSIDFKGGCLKKKMSVDQKINEVPNKIVYEKEDVAQSGEVKSENLDKLGVKEEDINAPKPGVLGKIGKVFDKKK